MFHSLHPYPAFVESGPLQKRERHTADRFPSRFCQLYQQEPLNTQRSSKGKFGIDRIRTIPGVSKPYD
ncbi:hypothetical protein M378DRAFT_169670 [Amanita muscaria Koide BX008]|uniref:Uncharacterized protein n=1 Tax=Amanita muscaria (strain Koide BX008) TaxID=946122 RepID=A0A0C2SYD5_AMAMK|nr:hypothetical protein M378DRAFT_169670 [Amanita muscaria Koide BX008]